MSVACSCPMLVGPCAKDPKSFDMVEGASPVGNGGPPPVGNVDSGSPNPLIQSSGGSSCFQNLSLSIKDMDPALLPLFSMSCYKKIATIRVLKVNPLISQKAPCFRELSLFFQVLPEVQIFQFFLWDKEFSGSACSINP